MDNNRIGRCSSGCTGLASIQTPTPDRTPRIRVGDSALYWAKLEFGLRATFSLDSLFSHAVSSAYSCVSGRARTRRSLRPLQGPPRIQCRHTKALEAAEYPLRALHYPASSSQQEWSRSHYYYA